MHHIFTPSPPHTLHPLTSFTFSPPPHPHTFTSSTPSHPHPLTFSTPFTHPLHASHFYPLTSSHTSPLHTLTSFTPSPSPHPSPTPYMLHISTPSPPHTLLPFTPSQASPPHLHTLTSFTPSPHPRSHKLHPLTSSQVHIFNPSPPRTESHRPWENLLWWRQLWSGETSARQACPQ